MVRRNQSQARYFSRYGGIGRAKDIQHGCFYNSEELGRMTRGYDVKECKYPGILPYPSKYVAKAAQQNLMGRKRSGISDLYVDAAKKELNNSPRLRKVNLGRKKRHPRQFE